MNSFPSLQRHAPRATLRAYLAAVILLATLPLVAMLVLQMTAHARQAQRDMEDALVRGAQALAQASENELNASVDALAALSRSEVSVQGAWPRLERLAQWRPRRDWDSMFLLDPKGQVIFQTGTPASAAVLAQWTTLRERVRSAGEPHVTGLDAGPADRRGISVGVPLAYRGEVYVLGARILSQVWGRMVRTAGLPEGAAYLYDADDQLVAHSGPGASPAGAMLTSQARSALQSAAPEVVRVDAADGQPVYAAWQAIPSGGWSAWVDRAARPVEAARRSALLSALVGAAVCLFGGLALAVLAARQVTRPLRQLARSGPLPATAWIAVEEIASLNEALRDARSQEQEHRAALQARAHEFAALFESSPIGMAFAQDPQCRSVLHNAAMNRLLGPLAALKGGSVEVRQGGRPLAPGQQPLQRAAALGEACTGVELEIRVLGRPPLHVLASAVPLAGGDGRPRGALSALVDITDRKQAEAKLLAADARLREGQRLIDLVQEAGHVGFFQYAFATDQMHWTAGQCKLFGTSMPGAQRLSEWLDLIDPSDRDRVERELWTACALRREKLTLEYACTPDGTARWMSSQALLQYEPDGRAAQLVGVTVDMTEQRRAGRERQQAAESARDEAQAASRAKDEFLTMLSHELRNPLGAIAAAADVLDAAPERSAAAVEARGIISRQTRNLAHMMSDLLDVGRVTTGKVALARRPVNLAALVDRLHRTLALTGEAAEHRLTLDVQEAWTEGDVVRLEQVATNLLTNALKYTPPGGEVRVSVRSEAAQAVLEVADSGEGIAPALLPHIFDLFVQGERRLDRRMGGLGIGLTLVRKLVELHGGSVEATSGASGSRFTVRLPLCEPPSRPEGDTVPPSRACRVLVVDDNADVLAALRTKLELEGHSVSTAADGVEGLRCLLALRPEISIVDIGLPGLTGYELARHARAAGYAGRMIALSGYGNPSDMKTARVAGFDAYLVKPVDRGRLRESLNG